MEKIEAKLSEVLTFWFEELSYQDWFSGSAELDANIKERFGTLHTEVVANEFWRGRTNARSVLAEVIVLDQFSRNMFRGSGQSFVYDGQALALAQQAISTGSDTDLNDNERMFLYMSFMHSESKLIHAEAVPLFESLGKPDTLKYEHIHKDIIDQFGRYPHRNKVLGRQSTPEEITYLSENHESFF